MKVIFKKYSHYLLLLYFPVYLISFVLIERVNVSDYYVSYLPIDDLIPFVPMFVVPYVMWYPYMLVPTGIMLFRDVPAFKRFMYYYIASMSASLLICFFFPNGQNLRVADSANNIFSNLISVIYSADTNTNVLPSMHVVGTIGVIAAAFDSTVFKRVRISILILGIIICASTVFIKQHSILDVFAGALLGGVTVLFVYGLMRRKGKGITNV